MKVLLVFPVIRGVYQATPDLGLGYLATALRKDNHDVKILHSGKEKNGFASLTNFLSDFKPQVVGFKVLSLDLPSVKKSLRRVKKFDSSIITIIGGPHPSTALPDETLSYFKETDFAFAGEAEVGLPLLLKEIEKNKNRDFSSIPGLIYRNGEKAVANEKIFIEDLDSFGIPDWESMNPSEYSQKESFSFFSRHFPPAPILVTRGCPFRCTFCSSHLVSGRRIRKRSIKNVMEEIGLLYKRYGVRELNIVDDNFAFDHSLVKDFCQGLISRRLDLVWNCPYGLRLDSLNREILEMMEESGCYSIAVGIESGSQRVLDHMKKRLTIKEIREKVDLIKKRTKLKVVGYFIIGYPVEREEDIQKTIRLSTSLPLDIAAFAPFRPTPGTEIFTFLQKKGILNKVDWSTFSVEEVAFSPPGISLKRLKFLKHWAYLKFYGRPALIFRLIREIRSFLQIKYLFRRFIRRIF